MTRPRSVSVLVKEGGDWIPFQEHRGGPVHAIQFENGWIWDTVSGWRASNRINKNIADDLDELAMMMHPASPTQHILDKASFELRRCWSLIDRMKPRLKSEALEPGD